VEHLAYKGQEEEVGQGAAFKSVGEETNTLGDGGSFQREDDVHDQEAQPICEEGAESIKHVN
jgi:hypothetical protein